jgi:hypothetical protein
VVLKHGSSITLVFKQQLLEGRVELPMLLGGAGIRFAQAGLLLLAPLLLGRIPSRLLMTSSDVNFIFMYKPPYSRCLF